MSNKTIALPELAASIAALAGCDADTARTYVVDTFARIQQQLAANRSADLPGVGTFRLDGADIVFDPDPTLAKAANTPFAMFEPIELPGDYTDEDADEDAPEAPVVQVASEVPAEQPGEKVEEAPAETAEESEEAPVAETAEHEQEEYQQEEYQEQEEDASGEASSRSYLPWLTAAFGLIAGLAIGYFIGTRCVAPMPALAIVEPTEQTSAAADTPAAIVRADTIVPEPRAQSVAEPEQPAVPEVKEPVYDKVSSSRFLTTIARDHYGRKDYWVFIYEANSDILRHPNKIRPGTRVVVPDLGENAAANAELHARAHKLAAEISARYDL